MAMPSSSILTPAIVRRDCIRPRSHVRLRDQQQPHLCSPVPPSLSLSLSFSRCRQDLSAPLRVILEAHLHSSSFNSSENVRTINRYSDFDTFSISNIGIIGLSHLVYTHMYFPVFLAFSDFSIRYAPFPNGIPFCHSKRSQPFLAHKRNIIDLFRSDFALPNATIRRFE